jgi:siroheme synthase-like protein
MLAVSLDLTGRRCVVLGGGAVAARKAATLVDEGAHVVVIAREVLVDLPTGIAALHVRPYRPGDLKGAFFVVAAVADDATNDAVLAEAAVEGTFVNVVDDLERATVHLMALHREGPVTVAVGTGGTSPALASRLRDLLAASLPAGVELAANTLAEERRALKAAGMSTEDVDWSPRLAALLGPVRPS